MTAPTPAITPELLIIAEILSLLRERHGEEKCRKFIVGRARRSLGDPFPPNVSELGKAQAPALVEYIDARRAAQSALKAFCMTCGGCELGRAITQKPPAAA